MKKVIWTIIIILVIIFIWKFDRIFDIVDEKELQENITTQYYSLLGIPDKNSKRNNFIKRLHKNNHNEKQIIENLALKSLSELKILKLKTEKDFTKDLQDIFVFLLISAEKSKKTLDFIENKLVNNKIIENRIIYNYYITTYSNLIESFTTYESIKSIEKVANQLVDKLINENIHNKENIFLFFLDYYPIFLSNEKLKTLFNSFKNKPDSKIFKQIVWLLFKNKINYDLEENIELIKFLKQQNKNLNNISLKQVLKNIKNPADNL